MLTLIHNNRCSKSREALALLEQHGHKAIIRHYLTEPLSVDEITQLLQQLGISARQLLRSKEDIYQELALDNPALSEAELIAAMAAHPKLIERPILTNGHRAMIGRPPEQILALL